jgi:Domain of unknown function (DUF3425)
LFAGKRNEKVASFNPPPRSSHSPRNRFVSIKPKPIDVECTGSLESKLQVAKDIDDLWACFHSAVGTSKLNRKALVRTASIWKPSTTPEEIISKFERWVKANYYRSSPLADHVLTLVKFNVFRAMLSNSRTLGFPAEDRMEDDALSPFPRSQSTGITTFLLPPSLCPTMLQCRVSHHPWIDLLPIPRMRDNLLLAGDSYDDLELCADLIGFYNSATTRTGLIVWREPWDPEGWEVTPSFLRRWGWTIIGCGELRKSTNYWRSQRFEPPMNFDKVLFEEVS